MKSHVEAGNRAAAPAYPIFDGTAALKLDACAPAFEVVEGGRSLRKGCAAAVGPASSARGAHAAPTWADDARVAFGALGLSDMRADFLSGAASGIACDAAGLRCGALLAGAVFLTGLLLLVV